MKSFAAVMERSRAYAANLSGAVQGRNGDARTFALARKLKDLGCTAAQALEILREWNRTCQPPWTERELEHKLECAYALRRRRAHGGYRTPTHRIEPDLPRVRALCDQGLNRRRLENENPAALSGAFDCAETYLRALFPDDPLLCCGWNPYRFDCMRLSEWGSRPRSMQFVVPSPAAAREGVTCKGRPSRHASSMFPTRHFLVVESDVLTHDEQAAVLLHLAKFLPLVLVVDSGGKSLHGYFDARNLAEPEALKFFRYARLHGADPTGWQIAAFKRMPAGLRDNGRRQSVLFFNPSRVLYA